jgi:hypothetical protein
MSFEGPSCELKGIGEVGEAMDIGNPIGSDEVPAKLDVIAGKRHVAVSAHGQPLRRSFSKGRALRRRETGTGSSDASGTRIPGR